MSCTGFVTAAIVCSIISTVPHSSAVHVNSRNGGGVYGQQVQQEVSEPITGVGWAGFYGYPAEIRGYPIAGFFPSLKPGYGALAFENYALGYYSPQYTGYLNQGYDVSSGYKAADYGYGGDRPYSTAYGGGGNDNLKYRSGYAFPFRISNQQLTSASNQKSSSTSNNRLSGRSGFNALPSKMSYPTSDYANYYGNQNRANFGNAYDPNGAVGRLVSRTVSYPTIYNTNQMYQNQVWGRSARNPNRGWGKKPTVIPESYSNNLGARLGLKVVPPATIPYTTSYNHPRGFVDRSSMGLTSAYNFNRSWERDPTISATSHSASLDSYATSQQQLGASNAYKYSNAVSPVSTATSYAPSYGSKTGDIYNYFPYWTSVVNRQPPRTSSLSAYGDNSRSMPYSKNAWNGANDAWQSYIPNQYYGTSLR